MAETIPPRHVLTRRRFAELAGAAGGLPAAYAVLDAMGAIGGAALAQAPVVPAQRWGEGMRVVVLGAGIAGLVAALELHRAGCTVTVLEAQERPGGRCVTLRRGDVVEEDDGTRQEVGWDDAPHLYFNPGPARIPHHHQALLRLCRTLGVAMEPLVNENSAALVQSDAAFGGAPVALRRVQADVRGLVAELAAKALTRGALDRPVSAEDLERLRGMLRFFGALDRDLGYRGGSRAGYAEPPGAGDRPGRAVAPLDAEALLRSGVWQAAAFSEGVQYAATMLQPVGGMDAIPRALAAALPEGAIVLGAEATRLRRRGEGGARVEWRGRRSGEVRAVEAEAVVVTLPAPVLARLDTDFAAERKAALAALRYAPAAKLAFQCDRRFWEEDAAIYGGISWTAGEIGQVWYPSHGFHSAKGVLVGAYIWGGPAGERFAARRPTERAAEAVADGERLHPGYGREVAMPVSVAWSRMPFARGAWGEWEEDQRRTLYPLLCAPEGPYHFAGEHLSWLPGWQEGSVLSAQAAVAAIAARRRG